MKLHPLTHIVIALDMALLAATLPVGMGIIVLVLGLSIAVFSPARTETRFTGAFLKVLTVGAFFLVLIHGFRLRPPGIAFDGVITAVNSFINIAAPVAAVMYLAKRIRPEEPVRYDSADAETVAILRLRWHPAREGLDIRLDRITQR